MNPDQGRVTEFIGVYDADGGLLGEASYLVGKVLGRRHCALCDITHSPVRRRPEWDDFVSSLDVPFVALHANEVPPDVAQAMDRLPIVLARTPEGLVTLLTAEDLQACSGSVDRFAAVLRSRTAERAPR